MRIYDAAVGVMCLIAVMGKLTSAQDWECSEECPNYESQCPNGRALEYTFMEEEVETIADVHSIKKAHQKSLRGKTPRRQLQEIEDYFQVKMHWEEGYCWQAEMRERKWCLDCAGGGACEEGDELEIRTCDEDDEQADQRFVWEWIDGSAGRLKPYHDQDLCLERVSRRNFALQPCDDEDDVSDAQILFGFDWNDPFKLIPKDLEDSCLTQDHYPRSGEVIYASDCDNACDDNTCLWEVY